MSAFRAPAFWQRLAPREQRTLQIGAALLALLLG
jgi:type II secretory pathway component PulM